MTEEERKKRPPKLRITLDVIVEAEEGETIVRGIAKVRLGNRPVSRTPAVANVDGTTLEEELPTDGAGMVTHRVIVSDLRPGKHILSFFFPKLEEWSPSREFVIPEAKRARIKQFELLKGSENVRAVVIVEGEGKIQFVLDGAALGEPQDPKDGVVAKEIPFKELSSGEHLLQVKAGDHIESRPFGVPEKPKVKVAFIEGRRYSQLGDEHSFLLCVKDTDSKPLQGVVLEVFVPRQGKNMTDPSDKNGEIHHVVVFPGGDIRIPVTFRVPGTDFKLIRWIYPA